MNQSIRVLLVFLAAYVLIVFFTCISELTYRGRTRQEILVNIRRIMLRSFFFVIVMIVASAVYKMLGVAVR
jgi:hypothetical protein